MLKKKNPFCVLFYPTPFKQKGKVGKKHHNKPQRAQMNNNSESMRKVTQHEPSVNFFMRCNECLLWSLTAATKDTQLGFLHRILGPSFKGLDLNESDGTKRKRLNVKICEAFTEHLSYARCYARSIPYTLLLNSHQYFGKEVY